MLRAVIAVLLLFFLGSPVAAEEELADDLGFTLELPADWFRLPKDMAKELVPQAEVLFANEDLDNQVTIFVTKEPLSERTMEYAIGSTIHFVYNKMRGFVHDETDSKVGGADAYRISYEGGVPKNGNLPKRYLRVLVIRNKILYTFQASARRDVFEKHEGTVDRIVKSVSWTNLSPQKNKENLDE